MASIAGFHNRTAIVSAIVKAIAATTTTTTTSSRLTSSTTTTTTSPFVVESSNVTANATRNADDDENQLIDLPQTSDEFFRLYAADHNDDVNDLDVDMDIDDMDMDDLDVDLQLEEEASKFIVGIWNPIGNLTAMNNDTMAGGDESPPITTELDGGAFVRLPSSTGPTVVGDLSSYFLETTTSAAPAAAGRTDMTFTDVDDGSMLLDVTTIATDTEDAHDVFSTLAQTVTETVVASLGHQNSQQHHLHNNNYGDETEDDIALIDSAETVLDGGDTDYGAAAAAEDERGLLHRTIAFEMGTRGRNDSSFYPNYDGGGGSGGDGDGGGDGVFVGNGMGVMGDRNDNSGSTFMLLLENFGEYFYNFNNSAATMGNPTGMQTNLTELNYRINCTNTTTCYDITEVDHNYWALILILFPILTLFGNILVILSVCRERSLQTVTNYFIVSLAIADLLVAVVVMPFAVYVLFNGIWALPNFVCDFYIAMDVICSTSSIFNLVAISIDRYIAVTQPIKYAKHRNSRRVCLTILLVWAISAAIGSPIVLGLNNTPYRDPDLCVFYNTDFILYSSLSSFYIPCIIMVFLYWNIFKALRNRARKQRAARKPHLSELTGGSVIENIAQTRRLAETALDNSRHASRIIPDEAATNTASGSNEEEDENAISPDIDDCHVIVNDKSTEFMLATVVEETGNVVAQITTQPQLVVADPNGNHDSGYAPSNVDDVLAGAADSSPPDSPVPSGTTLKRSSVSSSRRNTAEGSPKREAALSVAMKPLSFVRYGVQEAMTLARNDSTLSTTSKTSSRKDKKNSQASRFTIYKVHKASKKKREKSSAKKERKATKTLAIVLGVFLFCWVPFFTCNIMDAMCSKLNKDCRPGVTAFILTTWLGYINSFVNPVIYTIFNPEFRKAFKKIMHMG